MKKFDIFLVVFFIILAGFFSFYKLASRNLWCDEALNFFMARHIFERASITHPPLYFQFLHLIIRFGQSEFLLRLFSAIFGTLSVIIFYFFSREVAGRKIAVLGTLLLALSPLRIWYSQEVSPHMISSCLVLASIYSFYLLVNKATFKNLIFWIALNSLSFYTSNHSLILIPAQMLYFWIVRKEIGSSFIKAYWLGLLIQMLLYIPQAFNLLNTLSFIKRGFWIPPIGLSALKYTIMNFFLGYNGTALAYNLIFYIFCLILIFAIFQASLKNILRVFSAFGLFPLLVFFVSHPFIQVYLDRHNLIFMPLFFLVVSGGVLAIKNTTIRYAGCCLLVGLMAYSMINYLQDRMPLSNRQAHIAGVYIKKNVTDIISYVGKDYRSNDILAITSPGIAGPIYFYAPKDKKIYYFFAQDDNYWTRGMNAYKPQAFPVNKLRYVDTDWGKLLFMDSPENEESALNLLPRRIWLLQSSWSRDGSLGDNSKKIEKILKRQYALKRQKWIRGVLVSLYIKNNS